MQLSDVVNDAKAWVNPPHPGRGKSIILAAIDTDEPTEREQLVTEILQEVWLSSLVAWISGVEPPSSVNRKLEAAARLLLGGGE